ncbi:hypothetical protein HYX06_06700 [Candidatus Woesearchaeota archaeon]|nr:hypothetical protein [Candidatus Woesearchaeota archaeon]
MDVPERRLRHPDLQGRLVKEDMIPRVADLERRFYERVDLNPNVLNVIANLPRGRTLSGSTLRALGRQIPRDIEEMVIFEDRTLYQGEQPDGKLTVYARMYVISSAAMDD